VTALKASKANKRKAVVDQESKANQLTDRRVITTTLLRDDGRADAKLRKF
jgi:hypothetical protein